MRDISYFGFPGVNMKMKEMKIDFILSEISRIHFITVDEMMAKTRQRKICEARQIAMYVLRKKTNMTLTSIGMLFASMDHTTVIHAVQKVNNLKSTYPEYAQRLSEIMMSI